MTEAEVKTRREKILDQLQNLANTVKVEDVKFVVAQDRNLSALDDGKSRLTVQSTKFELAKQIPERTEKSEYTQIKAGDGMEYDGVGHYHSKKIQQHITDFKAKGKLENFRLRQALRRWREIAQEITRKHQEEENGFREEDNVFKLKIMRDDIGKQIKENLIKQRDFMVKTDDKPKIKNLAPKRQEEIISEIKKQSQEPGADLKRFIPFCNNIVLLNVQKKPQK